MSKPLVSVIVPVYNVEEYLAKCLDSLTGQSLQKIEIIVVNDGSPDRSQKIIDDYVCLYPDKIKSFTKPNGGQGDARNLGISYASADYIGFVDSDDHIHKDMFKDLYENITRNDCQVAVCQYKHFALDDAYGNYTRGEVLPLKPDTVYHGRDFILEAKVGVVWNKLYQKKLIADHKFPLMWFEDVAWVPIVMSHTQRFCYVPKAYYYWIGREGSTTTSKADLKTLEGIPALEYGLEHCNPAEKDAVAVYAAQRLLIDSDVRKGYADRYAIAFHKHKETLLRSKYIMDHPHIYYSMIKHMGNASPIPKTLYYDHFGRQPLSNAQRNCLSSWVGNLVYSDGEIFCLDESNCDVEEHPA